MQTTTFATTFALTTSPSIEILEFRRGGFREMAFRFPCYRVLKQELGEFDAVVECTELAVREFDSAARAAPDVSKYVTALSTKHGIRVNTANLAQLRTHVVYLYLVSVHQGLEDFLAQIKKEHPGASEWIHTEGEDLLTRIAKNVGFEVREKHRSLDFSLCQYYRGIRNQFVHPAIRQAKNAPESEDLRATRASVASSNDYKKLDAPHSYHAVTFDDFVLFTRAAKKVAAQLCEAGQPSDDVLSEIAWSEATRKKIPQQLKNNKDRLEMAVAGFLKTEYSLSEDEALRIVRVGPLA